MIGLTVPSTPAWAQLTVLDPNNNSHNLLTAARTLSPINNQIQSLQNEAAMILHQAKNLSRIIDFPQLQQITQTLQQVDRLIGQAQGIDLRIGGVDDQFRRLFQTQFNTVLTSNQQVANARSRLDTAMAAFRQTMGVQAKVVENVHPDRVVTHSHLLRAVWGEAHVQDVEYLRVTMRTAAQTGRRRRIARAVEK